MSQCRNCLDHFHLLKVMLVKARRAVPCTSGCVASIRATGRQQNIWAANRALLKHWDIASETSLSNIKSSKTTQGSEFGVFSIGVSAGWDV